ncbi:L-histidine N(alpha)-methyltransferase [Frigoriflavimonas asaccharolytica]|uniref:Dimethylhistidine N-methyltransferase n=1 Tax=Frigoriflavimonas asaccharolytica TaxID=2735899 RepID=A0A8J8K9H7_9FLAO|nr:L-histidine N(alpha)-methyltransferase [Frigoriflavimonas asaccharolytica]NRS93077.1 dimethylhistidine N-methyltransferase [Frigoriflavimonas asaccharolytica]
MEYNAQFLEDTQNGLSDSPKRLPSRYFYDKIGDKIFQEIMAMPEYYLTNSETEIFKIQAKEIINSWKIDKDIPFELIELGAGDGTKTIFLLEELLHQNYNFSYLPIDISQNVLDDLVNNLSEKLPDLKIEPKQGDYFMILDELSQDDKQKIVLFIGSNLGNLEDKIAAEFLKNVTASFRNKDKLLLGVDLKKDFKTILQAYNDESKITARFNLNLLQRMNNELGANFIVENFLHDPEYDEEEGAAKSYLKSLTNQSVHFSINDKVFHFEKDEKILMEISRKYDDDVLNNLLIDSGVQIKAKFVDSRSYFADYILEKK